MVFMLPFTLGKNETFGIGQKVSFFCVQTPYKRILTPSGAWPGCGQGKVFSLTD